MQGAERPGRHLRDYWQVLQRRRFVVYLAVAAVTLVALVGSFLITPLYRATTTLQIERQNPEIFTFRDVSSVDYSWSAYADFYQTEYRILSSEAVARKAVARLGLTSHPDFQPGSAKPGLYARLRGLFPSRGVTVPRTAEDVAAETLLASLEIAPVRNSHLVQISWVSPDPRTAARVANAVAEAYIQFTIEAQFTTSDQATEFLADQIGKLRTDLDAIERRLQQYGESKGIVSIDDNSNITMRALSDIATRRTEARTNLARAKASYDALRATSPEGLPQVVQSELITRLKGELAVTESEYGEKSRLFKDDWPGMQTLKGKLEQGRARVEQETNTIVRNVLLAAESDYRKAQEEYGNLDGLLRSQQGAAQDLKRDSVEFANLQGEAAKKREMLGSLIARQNEMALSSRLKDLQETSSNVRVVDTAKPPVAPFRPRTRLNVVLGLLLGAGLGIGMAFFLDYLDSTLVAAADAQAASGLPVLAVVPRHGDAVASRVRRRVLPRPARAGSADLVAHQEPKSRISEAYRELRTAVLLSSAQQAPRRIMVTSAVPEEGKSQTALNLAVVLAQLGRRVLLIDTDLRRPRLHRVFGLAASPGLSSYLSGLEELPVPVRTAVPGLDLLASGPIPPNPSELLNAPVFFDLAAQAALAGYEHLVFDTPPVLSVSDPLVAARAMDAVVVVVRAGRTQRESLRTAVERIRQVGGKPTGVVLNDLDPAAHGGSAYGAYGPYETVAPEQAPPRAAG